MEISSKFYSGTSGLVLPLPKKLFPKSYAHFSRLQYYATLFNSIEINSSFYKIPKAATLQRWCAKVQGNFTFTFKLWKGITHTEGLEYTIADLIKFMKAIAEVGSRKGCLLVQFPPSIKIGQEDKVWKLITAINECDAHWKIAVEFRDPSWYTQQTYDLLKTYDLSLVIQDMPKSSTPKIKPTGKLMYLRFHGPEGSYRSGYSNSFLLDQAQQIVGWIAENRMVYVYFNNTMGDALQNLETLNHYVTQFLNNR